MYEVIIKLKDGFFEGKVVFFVKSNNKIIAIQKVLDLFNNKLEKCTLDINFKSNCNFKINYDEKLDDIFFTFNLRDNIGNVSEYDISNIYVGDFINKISIKEIIDKE